MTTSPDILEQLRKEPGGEDLDLSWLDQPAAERGLRVAPGKRGLTLEDIATSSYGDIPNDDDNQSGRMRGAAPRSDAQRIADATGRRSPPSGPRLRCSSTKRRCSGSGAAPPTCLGPIMPELPEDIELAMSQLCTFLTQVEFIAGDVPGQYAPNDQRRILRGRPVPRQPDHG